MANFGYITFGFKTYALIILKVHTFMKKSLFTSFQKDRYIITYKIDYLNALQKLISFLMINDKFHN